MDARVLAEICEEAADLNPGDCLGADVLEAIAKYAGDSIGHSVETGCGGSTVLLSHLSRNHVVFAIEGEGRILKRVKRSPLFRVETTKFIEGPTQMTLPSYTFDKPIDFALIDGPHAFPFPQLEYFYFYPHMRPGAMLVLDDIHIRSVNDLYRFLCADKMFKLTGRLRTTAFFERTTAPAFNPHGDGWQEQRYNKSALLRYTWKQTVRERFPAAARTIRRLRHGMLISAIDVQEPRAGMHVTGRHTVSGHARLPAGTFLWVFVHRADLRGWWPQGNALVSEENHHWSIDCNFGEDIDKGSDFEVAVLPVSASTNARLEAWMEECRASGEHPPIALAAPLTGHRPAFVRVRRSSS